jgi:CRISPR/Cas system-associated exonuclease Cas4 (RecB family)
LIFILLLSVILLFYFITRQRKQALYIYSTEQYMKMADPIALCGALDVVWIEKSTGMLIVGDYKSRDSRQVYDSDIIQLSVYKMLLQHTQNKPVADYGFIHFRNGHRQRVKLLSEKQIVSLYRRYMEIMKGHVKPKVKCRQGYCRYCPHRELCVG